MVRGILLIAHLPAEAPEMATMTQFEGIHFAEVFFTASSVIKQSVVHDKLSKWQKIANEAVKQCERVDFPKIHAPMTLKEIIESNDFDIKIACVEREAKQSLKACLQSVQNKINNAKILVILGIKIKLKELKGK